MEDQEQLAQLRAAGLEVYKSLLDLESSIGIVARHQDNCTNHHVRYLNECTSIHHHQLSQFQDALVAMIPGLKPVSDDERRVLGGGQK